MPSCLRTVISMLTVQTPHHQLKWTSHPSSAQMSFVRIQPDNLARLDLNSRTSKKRLQEAHQLIALYRSSYDSHYDNASSTCHTLLLTPVTLDNVECITLCEKNITGQIWKEMFTNLFDTATYVPKPAPHLILRTTYNSPQ